MSHKPFYILILICCFLACKENNNLTRIEGQRISISDSIQPNEEIETYVKPFRERIEKDLDSVLAYAVDYYSKTDGHLNTAIGNLMADAVYLEANPIFKKRVSNEIDLVLLNHGGIRASIPQGNVTTRTAFEVMPFENSVYVVALRGTQVQELVNYLAKAKRAHPIYGLKLVLNEDFTIESALVKGETIDNERLYYVATSDYLFNGGDNMIFFKANDTVYDLNYKIRNVLIDYFKKTDTISPVIDDRFIQL
ncbi:MAG: 5'-nucleotidase C-terminal domain-containing protein [Bacteroidia bacterium]|nr:5'-nucleotidase C-terminal domain-containing protein [Bacteroidia bacterium]